MKQIRLLFCIVAIFISYSLSIGQTVNITFQVDMQEQTVSPNGVHIAGSFQGWNPGSTPMTLLTDAIYTYTYTGTAGEYIEYKFINGNAWGSDEYVSGPCSPGNGNRFYTLPSEDEVLPAVCFGSCLPCVLPPVDVTFQVDMANEIVSGNGVFLVGSFNGWVTDDIQMINTVDDVYSATVTLGEGEYHEYKFYNGDYEPNLPPPCGTGAYGNRYLTVPSSNTTLDVVCYGSCDPCTSVTDINVTFQVDMSGQTVSPDGVHIAGSFQGWNPGSTLMTDEGSGIWTYTAILQSGEYIQFKYINGTTWGEAEIVPFYCEAQGTGNRFLTVPNKNTVLTEVCFGYCLTCNPDPVDVTFTVDMAEQLVSSNGVHIAGSFQGWDPSTTSMIDQGDNIYQITLTLTDEFNEYKYVNGNDWGFDENVPFECNYYGNRYLVLPSTNKTLDTVCYASCGECTAELYTFDLKVFLEGPFNGMDMNIDLDDLGLLPTDQPFNTSPWNYDGTETITAPPETEITDWVFLEFRETDGDASTATPDKFLDHQAAILLADGSIVSPDGSTPVLYTGNITENLFVIIHHRNHLSIMSSNSLVETKGAFVYDFTDNISKAYGDGMKALGGGMYGMMGGDSDASGIVDMDDKDINWTSEAGNAGYYPSDLNLDSQVNNPDKNEIWESNLNMESQIPE